MSFSISRRRLIKLSAFSAAGLMVSQCGSRKLVLPAFQRIIQYLPKFAESLGFKFTKQLVDEFLSEQFHSSDSMTEEIKAINNIMARGGYTDLSQSEVYLYKPYFFIQPITLMEWMHVLLSSAKKINSG